MAVFSLCLEYILTVICSTIYPPHLRLHVPTCVLKCHACITSRTSFISFQLFTSLLYVGMESILGKSWLQAENKRLKTEVIDIRQERDDYRTQMSQLQAKNEAMQTQIKDLVREKKALEDQLNHIASSSTTPVGIYSSANEFTNVYLG